MNPYYSDSLATLFCGKSEELFPSLNTNSIDLTVTSPPYDNLRLYGGDSWDFEIIANELFRVTRDGGVVVWVVGDSTNELGESGNIEQDADVVLFVHRPEMYDIREENGSSTEGIAEIIIGKQRNGPVGTARLAFIKQNARFENLTKHKDMAESAEQGKIF